MKTYEESVPLLKRFSWRIYRRLLGGGCVSATLEDVMQECSIVWVKASRLYNPEFGASFDTYLWNAICKEINRWCEKEFRRSNLLELSLDADDDDDWSEHDVHAADVAGADEILEQKQRLERVLSVLSPRTRAFTAMLVDHPAELERELAAIRERRRFGVERGVPGFAPHNITSSLIFDLLGADGSERTSILKELKDALARLDSHE